MTSLINLTSAAYLFLAIGIITSVSIIAVHQVLLIVPAFYFLFRSYREKIPVISKSSFFLILFMLWTIISLAMNFEILDNPSKSFGKLKFLFFALSGISVLYYWIPKVNKSQLSWILKLFACSIVIAGLVAIYQVVSAGGGRSEGLIGVMRYGYASSMISVLLLGVILQRNKLHFEVNHKVIVLALLFAVLGIFLTQTRGALAGFLSAVPFVLYFYRPKLGIAVGFISAIVISIIAYAYLFGSGAHGSRYLKSRNEIGDVVRREQWQSAIIAVKESPIFGVGYNNFYSQVERIKKENNLKTTFYINEHSHNTFLEVAAGTGIVGAFFFLMWVLFWAIECFKMDQALKGIFVPFGVCIVTSSQFEVILDTNNAVLLFFVYSLSQCLICLKKSEKAKI